MLYVCGVRPLDATQNDLQRYFKCKSIHPKDCNDKGLEFPTTCSVPPCDQCSRGRISNSIKCHYSQVGNRLNISYNIVIITANTSTSTPATTTSHAMTTIRSTTTTAASNTTTRPSTSTGHKNVETSTTHIRKGSYVPFLLYDEKTSNKICIYLISPHDMSQNGYGQNGLLGLIAGRLKDHRQSKITNPNVKEKDQEFAILVNSKQLETRNHLNLKKDRPTAISMHVFSIYCSNLG